MKGDPTAKTEMSKTDEALNESGEEERIMVEDKAAEDGGDEGAVGVDGEAQDDAIDASLLRELGVEESSLGKSVVAETEGDVQGLEEVAVPLLTESVEGLGWVVCLAVGAWGRELSEEEEEGVKRRVQEAGGQAGGAAELAREARGRVDGRCERATARLGLWGRESRLLAAHQGPLQARLHQLQAQRDGAREQLHEAGPSLRQAQLQLQTAQAQARSKETGRDVGIGLCFLLPCVGIPMAVAFERERQLVLEQEERAEKAQWGLSRSREDAERLGQRLDARLGALRGLAGRLEAAVQARAEARLALREEQRGLEGHQGRVRALAHQLSGLAGSMAALGAQTRHLYSLEPVLPFIQAAALHALCLRPHPFLQLPTLQGGLARLQHLQPRLQALHNADPTALAHHPLPLDPNPDPGRW
ncbi:uncharacterized protein LOC129699827 [Leucoraja erinacea]|uniref:uncharacterized protein LOC129699827 n=1 Tax=Leucoraja erinaceus TaxID=7782 RepID=UPI002458C5FB|nr:uncharacterized protein LOC129699827 [Leucoraja erinacea]